jgi:hypothetical protein
MKSYDTTALRQRLASDWLTWTALRHFLPVPILHELVQLIVLNVSRNTVTLGQLFEEQSPSGILGLETWALRERSVESPIAGYLQQRIQRLVLQSDAESFPPEKAVVGSDIGDTCINLETAIRLGRMDFTIGLQWLRDVNYNTEPSLKVLADLIDFGKRAVRQTSPEAFAEEVNARLASVGSPLMAVLAKHVGDLCADVDEWPKAEALYDLARQGLSGVKAPGWEPYIAILDDLVLQSIAAAQRCTVGFRESSEQLRSALDNATLNSRPLLVINAPRDANSARLMSDTRFDAPLAPRGMFALPPLGQPRNDYESVIHEVNDERFESAQETCWAILRRQTALGLASAAAASKTIYARTILAQLEHLTGAHPQPQSFDLAVRLLVESGDRHGAEKLAWSEALVRSYVTEQLINDVIAIANRYESAGVQRRTVVMELMRSWSLRIAADRAPVVDLVMAYVADLAATGPARWVSNHDLAKRGFEILKDIAKQRPEFRRGALPTIHAAILSQLQIRNNWIAKDAAVAVAIEYLDVLSDEQARSLVEEVLAMLGAMSPGRAPWIIVQPALKLLASSRSASLSKSVPELGKRVLAALMRFGTEEDTEQEALLFHLKEFDPGLLRDSNTIAALRPVIEAIRKKLTTIRSSGAVGQIQALLLSPTVSGAPAIYDAFRALISILRNDTKPPAMSLPHAYAAVLMLIDKQATFAEELGVERSEVDQRWSEVYESVINIWDVARSQPLVLAPFSLPPPTAPSTVVVHNWAFTSVRFADSIGRKDEMVNVLRAAAQDVSLRDAIALGMAAGSEAAEDFEASPETLPLETAEVFYSTLGRRVLLLNSPDPQAAAGFCSVLLQQCFRNGPRGLDAAVLVCAYQLGLAGQFEGEAASNYLKRVNEHRELRLALLPLLEALKVQTRPS